MKRPLLLLFFIAIYYCSFCQVQPYWQQQVNYKIDVSLNDTLKTLDGYLSMQYYNNSPDSLNFIWIHVWPNAYKNDRTAFSDQFLENDRKDFYFSDDNKRGYLNRLDFKVDKISAVTAEHPKHQDIIKLLLPKPLAPGAMASIETPFHVKLPFNFSRGGFIGNSFHITQWYPKPAVYDKNGWHEMPYLDQGEFYSEFGKYNVQVTLPVNYIVAATGVLQNEILDGNFKTLNYVQDNVHDFAWFTAKNYTVLHDSLQLDTHKVHLYAYYLSDSSIWKNSISFLKKAITTKSNLVGEYPYDIVSVVESPGQSGGGMEYPTITLLDKPDNNKMLEELINHEVGHNWFYGILASNERLHPWMDEGMNTYYDKRYRVQNNEDTQVEGVTKSSFLGKRIPDDFNDLLLASVIKVRKDQPIETPSTAFSSLNYGVIAYYKTAQWMQLLEAETGRAEFDKIMKAYFFKWKFKHPSPGDFKKTAEEISGKNLDSVFSLLNKKGPLQSPLKKDIRITSFFSLKHTDKHRYIFLSPAIGYNYYDKLMLGGLIHNYTLPSPKLQFLAAPLYATGTKKLNGLGRISYTFYPGNADQKLELAVSGAKFTVDDFTDSTGRKNAQPFYKVVPSLKYIFAARNPRSKVTKFIQWKTFLISETNLSFTRDTMLQQDIISYPKQQRYLNQLQFVIENNRALYPFRASFMAEQGKGFARLNFTGNYFFNYPKQGGLSLRLFAGKFIYTGEKTFVTQYETDRYHLNMSGPKGYEDYTYSNYFIGRNEFEGLSNQQIMNRDGAFKVRTDLLSDKIGKTDDWLTAVNFTTTIPKQVNPLSLLPVKIPVKLFCDIGTYAEAWKKNNSGGKLLYDAGFQLSILKDLVNIYFPLLYSSQYSDYFKSTITEKRFKRNISFSIDIQKISIRKLFPQIPF